MWSVGIFLSWTVAAAAPSCDRRVDHAALGHNYSDVVHSSCLVHYIYRIPIPNLGSGSLNNPRAMRLRSVVRGHHDSAHPLRVTVESDHNTLNWRLPIRKGNITYDEVERTIVTAGNNTAPEQQLISVVLSTLSKNDVNFTIELYEVKDFILHHNDTDGIVANVSAHAPKLYYIDLRRCEDESKTLHIHSSEDVCAIVSLQKPDQSLIYTEDVMRNDGPDFQSMLGLASFDINQEHYGDGVFIMFMVAHNDSLCSNVTDPSLERAKSFTFSINDPRQANIFQYLLPLLLSIGVAAILVIFHLCCHSFNSRSTLDNLIEEICQREGVQDHEEPEVRPEHSSDQDHGEDEQERLCSNLNPALVAEIERITERQEEADEELISTARQRERVEEDFMLTVTSKLHWWFVVIVGLFFVVPALQITYREYNLFLHTGNQDICYYNFLCSNPIHFLGWEFSDFNHILSHVHEIIFGLAFLILVRDREMGYQKFLEKLKAKQIPTKYGLLQHHGIYYAMCWALVFDGILSAIFHICPTLSNYQFDSTFVYILAFLIISKIYQFRHPKMVAKAYKVYLCIGCIRVLEVIGIYSKVALNRAFMEKVGVCVDIAMPVVHFLCFTTLAYTLYHPGQFNIFSRKPNTFVGMARSLCNLVRRDTTLSWWDLVPLGIGFWLNIPQIVCLMWLTVDPFSIKGYLVPVIPCSLVIFGNLLVYSIYILALKRCWCRFGRGLWRWDLVPLGIGIWFNIPQIACLAVTQPGTEWYLLYVFAGNLNVYTIYYLGMKIRWAERIMITTWVCLLLLVATSVTALIYLNQKVYDFSLTPAQSRNLNENCAIPFLSYDNHNIWEMLGATAIFLSFYFIMTLDDELFKEPRGNIKIF